MDDRREMLYAGLLFIALALLFGALARGQAATLPDRPFNDTTPADCNKRTGNATTTLGCFDVLPGDIKRMVSGSAPGGDIIVADESESLVLAELTDPAEYWKTVTLYGDGYQCRISEFVQVAAEVDAFLPKPDDPTAQMTPAIYVQPLSEADRLRAQADEIERRSAVLLHWRKVLAECKRAILGDKP